MCHEHGQILEQGPREAAGLPPLVIIRTQVDNLGLLWSGDWTTPGPSVVSFMQFCGSVSSHTNSWGIMTLVEHWQVLINDERRNGEIY